MVKIITFEGADYSGKSATLLQMAKRLSKRKGFIFNEGPIYPTELTARLLILANQSNELDREFLYTMSFAIDKSESSRNHSYDNRVVFQDRYWPSVIAYGRFLNENNSIHNHQEFRELFINPFSTIYFSCSIEEKIKRSNLRGRKSIIDKILLSSPDKLKRLEREIDKSIECLPNIFRIDTTHKSIEEVSLEVEKYAKSLNLQDS